MGALGRIYPNGDLDLAVTECVRGALSFNGQRCTALKMLIVHESVHDELVSAGVLPDRTVNRVAD